MIGSILVQYKEDRDVFVDTIRIGTTNLPLEVQTGTHDIDLGAPVSYYPKTQKVKVVSKNTPLQPLVVVFTHEAELL